MESRNLSTYRLKIQKKSQSSKDQFEHSYKKYANFAKDPESRIAELRSKPVSEAIDELQNYYNFLTNHPRTNKIYTHQMAKFFRYLGIQVSNELIKEEIDFAKIPQEELHPLSMDEIKTILNACLPRKKALFLVQLSSGIRIGELVQLRKKHFVYIPEHRIFMIKIPANIAKFQRARTTFISKEAIKAVAPILNKKQDEELVFGTSDNVLNAKKAEIGYLNKIKDTVGLNQKYESNHTDLIGTHSFRAFFITHLSRKDPNLAKLLAGQKGYLLQYDRLDDSVKLDLYKQYESELLVFDDSKKDQKIQELQVLNEKYQEQLAKNSEIMRKLHLHMNNFILDKTVPDPNFN